MFVKVEKSVALMFWVEFELRNVLSLMETSFSVDTCMASDQQH